MAATPANRCQDGHLGELLCRSSNGAMPYTPSKSWPSRYVVERALAWITCCRRYECLSIRHEPRSSGYGRPHNPPPGLSLLRLWTDSQHSRDDCVAGDLRQGHSTGQHAWYAGIAVQVLDAA